MRLDVDKLLQQEEPDASLHDADLLAFLVDWQHQRAELHFSIEVAGSPRSGMLVLDDVEFFACEAPREPRSKWRTGGRWIAADGPFPDSELKTSLTLPNPLSPGAFCHYFFAADTNSLIVVAAKTARFDWK